MSKDQEGVFSCEFFPPKTAEGQEKLRVTKRQLEQLKPRFFSVTFGAGGTTRDGTLSTVLEIQRDGFDAAPHLSCIGGSRENIASILDEYKANGIRHVVALRGDMPSGMVEIGEFRYASELIAFIREHTGDWFHIEAAAYPEVHPQAKSPQDDLLNFKRKIDAGANAGITQYFYNADAYFRFMTNVPPSAWPCRSSRASCRSPISRSLRVSQMRVAPRFHAGCVSNSSLSAMIARQFVRLASMLSPNCAIACYRRAHRACISTRSTWRVRQVRYGSAWVFELRGGAATIENCGIHAKSRFLARL